MRGARVARKRAGCLVPVAAAVASACSPGVNGPTPEILSIEPSSVCNGQVTPGVVLSGQGFAAMPKGALAGTPRVELPDLTLDGPVPCPSEVALDRPTRCKPAVTFVDDQTLRLTVASGMFPARYKVIVENPNGTRAERADLLTVVPPPKLVNVDPPAPFNGVATTLTLTGLDFIAPVAVTLGTVPRTALVASRIDATTVQAELPPGLAAGTYGVRVANPDRCFAELPTGLRITDVPPLSVRSVEPRWGYRGAPTRIAIAGNGFRSTPRAALLSGALRHDLVRVAFVSASVLSAEVPAGIPAGTHDLEVANRGGVSATLARAFAVAADPPPTIASVDPPSASTAADQTVRIRGDGYSAPPLTPSAVRLIDATGQPVDATGVTVRKNVNATPPRDEIIATVPSATLGLAGVFAVRVANPDGCWGDFAPFAVRRSGQAPGPFVRAGGTLLTARRSHAALTAGDDRGNRFLYVLGGIDGGAVPQTLASIEVALLDAYGRPGAFRALPFGMAERRTALAAVAVPVTDPATGRTVRTYLLALGGSPTLPAAVATVERATVLSSATAPRIISIVPGTGGTLGAGTWYYRVTAVFDGGDPDYPTGTEGLPSDEAVVDVPANGQVRLTWSPPSAAGTASYRVYRTEAADGASGTEVRLAATVSGTSFDDTGAAPGAGREPAPGPGSLSLWKVLAGPSPPELRVARGGAAAVLARDPGNVAYLYVLGGTPSFLSDQNARDDYEYAEIGPQGELRPPPGSTFVFAAGTLRLTPRYELWAAVADAAAAPAIGANGPFVLVGGGYGRSTALRSVVLDTIESAAVSVGGALGTLGGWSVSVPRDRRAGAAALVANDSLFTIGGHGGAATYLRDLARLAFSPCQPAGACPDLAIPAAAGQLAGPTYAAALARTSIAVYLVGGSTNGQDVLGTVDWATY